MLLRFLWFRVKQGHLLALLLDQVVIRHARDAPEFIDPAEIYLVEFDAHVVHRDRSLGEGDP